MKQPRVWMLLLLSVAGMWLTIARAQGEPAPQRFRAVAPAGAAIGLPVLTPEERRFLAALPEVRVAVYPPTMLPYERVDSDGTVTGIHPDLLAGLAATFGIRLRPVAFPSWSEALQAARERRVDLLMTVGVTTARQEFLEFTLGVTPAPAALFARTSGPEPALENATFALQRDFFANEFVRRQYPQARILTVETTIEALRAVADGRASFYLGSLLEAREQLERQPVVGVEARRLLNHGTGFFHFAVRKDWAPLAGILNRGIQTARTQSRAEFDHAIAALAPALRPAPLLTLDAAQAEVLLRHPVWRVGAVRGLRLLNDVDEQGVHSGIGAEYSEQVGRRLGVATRVVPFPNVAAMLDGLRRGDIDLIPFLTRTPEREREFRFSQPYVSMPYMLVARNDGPLYWGLASLEGRRLALALGHPLRPLVAERYPKIDVVDADNGSEAMDQVARGDADAAVEVKLFANLRINSDNDGRLRVTAAVEELPAEFQFAVAQAQPELLPLVDRALASIEPAERDRMFRRWVAVDLQPPFPWRRYLPALMVAGTALLLLVGLTLWWNRRLAREVKARRAGEALINDITQTVPAVVFRYVIGPDERMKSMFFTDRAAGFFGVPIDPTKSLLMNLAPWLHPAAERDAAVAAERHSLLSGEPFHATGLLQPPNGPARWLHCQAEMKTDAEGQRVWTGYVADVSTERDLQQRLAHEAQARSLLLAAASHELRAPTHNLSLALQSVDAQELPQQARQSVKLARRAAATLTQLLNDVLDAARMDRSPTRLRPVVFGLRELLDELAEAWGPAAADKGLVFRTEFDPALPASLEQDPLRLKQVLTNLLSNAVKYTREGEVRLVVRRSEGELALAVHDSGPGITDIERERLFQPFTTLHDGSIDPGGGGSSGLGLMVARRIAHLLGGRIEVDSVPGHGSTFTLHLPLDTEPAPAPEPLATLEATTTLPVLRCATVVVCDDDPVARLLTAQMLRLRGYAAIEASDGASALALWQDGAAALVTDLDMPGMQGHELIARLRAAELATETQARADREASGEQPQRAAARRTVVIVCSGSPVPEAEIPRAGHDLGYDAWLIKPLSIDTLVNTLKALGLHPPPTEGAEAVG